MSTNDLQLNADFVFHKICDLGAVSTSFCLRGFKTKNIIQWKKQQWDN